MVNSVPNTQGLPLFINDANYDQNPLRTFTSFPRLQQIKAKYDPDSFFANYYGWLVVCIMLITSSRVRATAGQLLL